MDNTNKSEGERDDDTALSTDASDTFNDQIRVVAP